MPRLARHNSHSPGQVWQPAQGRRMLQQSHRIYDENTVCRLRRILLLRKLRIPVRQIKIFLQNPSAATAVEIFQKNINELNEEITALSTIREILSRFAGGLYAAHMIAFGNFNEWEQFFIWANQSEKYEFAGDMKDQEHMCGMLEEHLNPG